jgi:hypothetical protein
MILERKNPLNMTNMPKNITVNDSNVINYCTSQNVIDISRTVVKEMTF